MTCWRTAISPEPTNRRIEAAVDDLQEDDEAPGDGQPETPALIGSKPETRWPTTSLRHRPPRRPV